MLTLLAIPTVPSQDDLEDNFAKLSLPWDPTSPIETVFTAAAVATVRNRRWRSDLGCHCPRKVLKTFRNPVSLIFRILE
jgi:hypothetical protein